MNVTGTINLPLNYSNIKENIPRVTRRLLTVTKSRIKMEAKRVVHGYDNLKYVSQYASDMVVVRVSV